MLLYSASMLQSNLTSLCKTLALLLAEYKSKLEDNLLKMHREKDFTGFLFYLLGKSKLFSIYHSTLIFLFLSFWVFEFLYFNITTFLFFYFYFFIRVLCSFLWILKFLSISNYFYWHLNNRESGVCRRRSRGCSVWSQWRT